MKLLKLPILLAAFLSLQAKDLNIVAKEMKERSSFRKLVTTKKFFLRANDKITSLKGLDQIPNIENTWVVNLQGNKIEALKANSFNNPKFKNIKWLNLSYNNITVIEPEAFVGLENLQVLFLGHNKLESFKPNTFKGLKNLRVLTLDGNPNEDGLKVLAEQQLPRTLVTTKRITKKFVQWTLAIVGVAVTITAAGVAIASSVGKQTEPTSSIPSQTASTLIRVKVAPQGANLTCGYHAVKNVFGLLLGRNDLLNNPNWITALIGNREEAGELRANIMSIVAERNNEMGFEAYPADGENLDEIGMRKVINLVSRHIDTRATIDIISNVENISSEILRNLRSPGLHPIVLRTGGENGHWVAVLIDRQDQSVTYKLACSLNKPKYEELQTLMLKVDPTDY